MNYFPVFTSLLLTALLTVCYDLASATVVMDDANIQATATGVDRRGWEWTTTITPNPVIDLPHSPGATRIEHEKLNRVGQLLWPTMTFQNGTGIPGEFHVIKYDAFVSQRRALQASSNCDPTGLPARGPDCFTLEFRGNRGQIGQKNLYWIQFVCSSHQNAAGGACPPENRISIDGAPGVLNIPFYLDEAMNASNTQINPNGDIVFTIKDKPARNFPDARETVTWRAHLYLVEWNKTTNVVTIHNGTEWGFTISCATNDRNPDSYKSGGVDSNTDRPDVSFNVVSGGGPPPPQCTLDFNSLLQLEMVRETYGLMKISPDEKIIYVVDSGNNELVFLDATTAPSFDVIERIKVGTDPRDIAVTQDGTKLYVTNHFDNTVSVIDTASRSVIKTIPVDHLPWGIDFNEGKVFVANWGGKGASATTDLEKGTITVIDSRTDQVTNTLNINSTDTGGPWGMRSSPDGTWIAVTNDGTHELILVNTITFDTKTIELGKLDCFYPWDLDITEDGKVISACGNGPNFFPIVQVSCPEQFEVFEQCEIDSSQSLPYEGDSLINEPWAVYAKDDKIYAVDMYNTAKEGEFQKGGSLAVWDANTLDMLEKLDHENYPEIIGEAPLDVIVTNNGDIFVSSVGTHEISSKQKELSGVPFEYPSNDVNFVVSTASIGEKSIDYAIADGTVSMIEADAEKNSLVVNVESSASGKLIIRLPDDLIEPLRTGEEPSFDVQVDGVQTQHKEIRRMSETILTIPTKSDTSHIEITGSNLKEVTVDYTLIAIAIAIAVAAATVGIAFTIKRRGIPSTP